MGLFKKNKSSVGRIAVNGGEAFASPSDKKKSEEYKKSKKDELELFGDDSDESDDDATIERYAGGASAQDQVEDKEVESKRVSTLTSKLSPEELFSKYDTDGSGNISLSEFLAMLPDLGINITEAKAIRIFRKADTDGTGEIDLTEFKMAMFAVDPVSGNTLGFSPSNFLSPKDAFDLFDTDGTGHIDEVEFADVLEYFGLNVTDEKLEYMFKKYDSDKSGFIDYQEFRSVWLRLSNPREELLKRGVEIPKYATRWKLQQILEQILDDEEAKEALVIAEAERFLQKQREMQRKAELGRKALIRAQDELAAALDAAGQLYVLGTGHHGQFTGTPVIPNEDLFPGYKDVSELWSARVSPKPMENKIPIETKEKGTIASPLSTPSSQTKGSSEQEAASFSPLVKVTPPLRGKSSEKYKDMKRFVRRREENKRFKFVSPPKLDPIKLALIKSNRSQQALPQESFNNLPSPKVEESEEVKKRSNEEKETVESQNLEELVKIFFEDREFVRALRFRGTRLMTNTGSLWGRGIVQGTITENVAFAVTYKGNVYNWGGKNNAWEVQIANLLAVDLGSDEEELDIPLTKSNTKDELQSASSAPAASSSTSYSNSDELIPSLTPRSALQKMSTPEQLKGMKNPELEAREEQLLEAALRKQAEDAKFERQKKVTCYYDVWEPPSSNSTRFLFMEQILLPRLDFDDMMNSLQYRQVKLERITKLDLVMTLGECFELEIEIKGLEEHLKMKHAEKTMRQYVMEKNIKALDVQKSQLIQTIQVNWEELRCLREEREKLKEDQKRQNIIDKIYRAENAYEAMVARRKVQLEDTIPEYTARGTNLKIELSGITTRGPPLHSPRGAVAVSQVVAGGGHVALVMHDGSLYTWGIGCEGRLGHQKNVQGALHYDLNHPQRVTAFQDTNIRQVSCGHSHNAAINADGDLFTWGSATSGKLGVGFVEDTYEQHTVLPLLVKFPGKKKIRSVSCGAAHTGAVTTSGELYMWGCANGGRLGLGDQVVSTVVVPTIVKDLQKRNIHVWQVSCGNNHSAICTEVTSETSKGCKTLHGGEVYVCGGAGPLGRPIFRWEVVKKLKDIAIRQVSCGFNHTAAVSSYGELYTWGRNSNGCTGHSPQQLFIPEPKLLKSLHVEPYNLALDKPCKQMSVYNEQGPHLAVNGDVDGRIGKCIHTHFEDRPWWEVNLGQPAVIERIRIWNRTDEPLNPSKDHSEYTGRLFPFWILISESPFRSDLVGKDGLRAAKVQSSSFEQFTTNQRMTEWVLPTANTVGQYIRIQLQGKNFLHFAEVEVFGVYTAFQYVGRVGSVQCANEVTMVVVPPFAQQSIIDDYYLRAIIADADNATILRQYEAYKHSYDKFGRGYEGLIRPSCRLCRAFHKCEICDFYSQANVDSLKDEHGQLPMRMVGDRLGLKDLLQLILEEEERKMGEDAKKQQEEQKQQKLQKQLEIAEQKRKSIFAKASDAIKIPTSTIPKRISAIILPFGSRK